MQWSKPSANILLCVVCLLVIRFSTSANRVGGNTRRRFGEKQHHEASKRENKPCRFEGISTNSSELNYPEGRKVYKPTSSELNRRLSRLSESNARKRIYKSRRISKRNANMSEATQPTVTSRSPPVCSGQQSCSGRCTGNITEWRTDKSLACYCDAACYEIFNDCCTDYTKYCGVQKASNVWIKKFKWTCEPFGHFTSQNYNNYIEHCKIGEGLWMVSRCASDWPYWYDKIRQKCEYPAKSIQRGSDIRRYVPVVNRNVTFRNYFCAKCNRITGDLEYFPVDIETNFIPPERTIFGEKLLLLILNGAKFPEREQSRPKSFQARRYCLRWPVADFCLNHSISDACRNGPVSLVSGVSSSRQYKNYHCAICNDPGGPHACFPSSPLSCYYAIPQQKFQVNLDYYMIMNPNYNEENSSFTVRSTFCGKNGLTFDDKLQDCISENFPAPSEGEDKFRILAWFLLFGQCVQFTESDFKTIMKQNFGVEESKIYSVDISLGMHSGSIPKIRFYLASSTLLLTPEQSFDVLFDIDSPGSSKLNIQKFIHFKHPLFVTLNGKFFSEVVKTTFRQLSCITRKIYTPQEYEVLDNEQIFINSTNTSYKKSEYYGQIDGNITICEAPRKLGNCRKNQTGLTKIDFIINRNLGLYQKNTGMLYELGQYDVFNKHIFLCTSNKTHSETRNKSNYTFENITAGNDLNAPVCGGQQSCSGRCTGSITEWRIDESLACYCDAACYEIFNDCCTDYTKYCGVQKASNIWIKKFKWSCEPFGHFTSKNYNNYIEHCKIGEGLWMVSRCASDWPYRYDEIRQKCEYPAKSIQRGSDISRYVPVVNRNVTFRNYFCANCNRIAGDLEYFPVDIETNFIPSEHTFFYEKLFFLIESGAKFPKREQSRPKSFQARRYCLRWPIADFCVNDSTLDACRNGPVALVSDMSSSRQYKNYECAFCNNPGGPHACFPFLRHFCHYAIPQQKFQLKLDYDMNTNHYQSDSSFTVRSTFCGKNELKFDDKLQECVSENFSAPSGIEDKFRILAWFRPWLQCVQFSKNDFKTVMKQNFGVEDSQIYNVDIVHYRGMHSGSTPKTGFYLASSTLILTPEQSFDVLFDIDSPGSSKLNIRRFIHFKHAFLVTLNGTLCSEVMKTTFRQLSCITRKIYTPQEYEVTDNEQIYISSTNITYKKSEYYGQINSNITICEAPRKLSNCGKNQTGLTKSDFIINSNLSLYHKNTGMLYELGQYYVFNKHIFLCTSNKTHSETRNKCNYTSDNITAGNDVKAPEVPTCSNKSSCQGRCSNHTEWRTENKMRCSCDPDCYEVFNDCCSDYVKYCGAQKRPKTPNKYNYTCKDIGVCPQLVLLGLWIVAQCRPDWPHDAFRAKCDAAKKPTTVADFYGYLPVLGYDNTTFRNKYCAICNGVQRYQSWPLVIETDIIPPENYNITEKIRYMSLLHGAIEWPRRPGLNQARRYCLKSRIDYCPMVEKVPFLCSDGDVALISSGDYKQFKNTHCAACHGVQSEMLTCFPELIISDVCYFLVPKSFSLVLAHGQTGNEIQTQISMRTKPCKGNGLIFDNILQVCRVNWISPPKQSGQERFYVYAWLTPPQNSQNSFTSTEFQDSLAKYLNISRRQIFDINVTSVLDYWKTFLFYLVSSAIALTPHQSLELLSINRSENAKSSETNLLNYIHFSQAFSLQIKGLPYTVAKTTSRPLACVGKITYTPGEYTLKDQDRVYIPSTNKTYEHFEYYRESAEQLKVKRGNITVCERFISTQCNGSIVQYKPKEYTIMLNLSIYVNKTSSLYDYGQYEILSNKSVAICQDFKVDIITEAHRTIRDIRDNDDILGYITFISFLLSILFLIFLFVTYILFPQLRTLPGKNLMNFAASLLLFQIFWLPSNFTEVLSNKPVCKVIAIMEHYFLMASFVSMGVIAFHTFKVFATRVPAPKMSPGGERKLFRMYLAFVWLLPGVFVGSCVVLDDQDILKIGYGESEICWLTEKNAYAYFVIIPIAVLLLFNTIAFVITAVYLRKHSQSAAAKRASGNRRSNLSIYAKLSTLMGFTWLFGLLALVVTSTIIFWYFFVIFTSLQGVFVAMAFVVKAKTFGLYKQRFARESSTPNINLKRRNVPTNAENVGQL